MVRSKAIARFRGERREALDRWTLERSQWRNGLGERAKALCSELNAEAQARAAFRQALAVEVEGKRRAFVNNLEEARLAQAGQRADFIGRLVAEVNRLVLDHCDASAARRERAQGLSSQVRRHLSNCREYRVKNSAEQASQLKTFRTKVASLAYQACTDDF